MRSWVEGGREEDTEHWREGERRKRDGKRQAAARWWIACKVAPLQLEGLTAPLFWLQLQFPTKGRKREKLLETLNTENHAGLMGSFRGAADRPEDLNVYCRSPQSYRKLKYIFNTIWGSFVWNHIRFSRNISKIPGIVPPDPQNSLNYILRNCSTKKIPILSRTLLRFSPSAQQSPDFADHTQAWI